MWIFNCHQCFCLIILFTLELWISVPIQSHISTSLCSIYFHILLSYYECIRLLISHLDYLDCYILYNQYLVIGRYIRPPRYPYNTLTSHLVLWPTVAPYYSSFTNNLYCLRLRGKHQQPLLYLFTGLNHFTLSHLGSKSFLPTLNL